MATLNIGDDLFSRTMCYI